jgi:tetratricopeptide (TPR) repeat protein
MRFRALLLVAFIAAGFAVRCEAAGVSTAALLAQGDALDKQLKTSEALAVFLEAEKSAPTDAEVLRRVAKANAELMTDTNVKARQKELGLKAVDYARRAVAADPKNALAQLALAICYGRVAPLLDNQTKINYSKLVKEHAEKSLSLDPSNDYAYHVLGAWHYELAGLNPLLRAIAKMIYGGLPDASYEEAVKYFKKAIELAPQRVAHHVELGRTYAAMGQTQLARTELNQGLSLPNREKDDPDTKDRARAALQKL